MEINPVLFIYLFILAVGYEHFEWWPALLFSILRRPFWLTAPCVCMALAPAHAAVSAGSLIRGFSSDAMFPDVEQEGEKILISLA